MQGLPCQWNREQQTADGLSFPWTSSLPGTGRGSCQQFCEGGAPFHTSASPSHPARIAMLIKKFFIKSIKTACCFTLLPVLILHDNHHSQGNSTNCYIILGSRDKAASPTCQQIGSTPSEASEVSTLSSIFIFCLLPRPQESSLCSQPIRGMLSKKNWTMSIASSQFVKYPKLGSRSKCLPNFFLVQQIPQTRFAKQKFAQLKTMFVDLFSGSTNTPK